MVKIKLDWQDIRSIGSYDKAGRWYPYKEFAPYFEPLRSPSRAFPYSYAKAAQTYKFFAYLLNNHPETACRFMPDNIADYTKHILEIK